MTLVAEDLSVTVSGHGRVLADVSARFASCEVVGITGPSGAGKSTLARALCGLQRPDTGQVWVEGKHAKVSRRSRHQAPAPVQLAFQNALATFPSHLSVAIPLLDAIRRSADEIGMGRGRGNARDVLMSLLQELGIAPGLIDRRPGEISGGQLQRLALTRALSPAPSFLVLDEITSALDPLTERQVLEVVGRYRLHHELGLVVISHDIGLLERNCDRIHVMDDGRIVDGGDAGTLFATAVHPTTQALARAYNTMSGGII